MNAHAKHIAFGLAVWAIGIAALLAHARLNYSTFFFDDSFISLRYAERLISGQGLTWTDGERVEGYSNLLWVLLVAGLGVLGSNLVAGAQALGLFCTSLALASIVLIRKPTRIAEALPALYAVLALALVGPFAAWATGGLETPLLVALLGFAMLHAIRFVEDPARPVKRLWAAGAFLALACLTRPDAPLFAVMIGFGLVLTLERRSRLRAPSVLLVLPAIAVAAQTSFRVLYYGAWTPNTSSKLGTNAAVLKMGLRYTTTNIDLYAGLVVPALFALLVAIWDRPTRRRTLLIIPPLFAWLAYLITIGGDFMPQRRHLVPAMFLTALLGSEGLAWLVRRRGALAAGFLGLGFAGLVLYSNRAGRMVDEANNNRWYWNARPIAEFFVKAFGDKRPLLAVDAAGALPYFSRLPSLDMLGLNDRYIATHPRQSRGNAELAHELGDGDYVFSRKPDLVVFHLPDGQEHGEFVGGVELEQHRDFRRFYQLIQYRTPGGEVDPGMVWIRKEDGPIGIQRTADRIEIPGYLLTADVRNYVEIGPDGKVGARVEVGMPAAIRRVNVPAGLWCASVEGFGDLIAFPRVDAAERSICRVATVPAQSFDVVVALRRGSAGYVHRVTLARSGGQRPTR